MYATTIAATLAFASSASAHMFISSPSPISGNAIKDPLDPSGSNFPCHGVTPPGSGGAPMAVGSSQILAFDTGSGANTAVHGGGSCQISLTYETDPAKLKDPSSWKVLYSILGGCPTNSPGNLGSSFQGPNGGYSGAYPCTDSRTNGYDCVNTFNFTIPQGVKSGQGTLAWTWFNTIGNREMYMNCVAVNIQGGSNDASSMSSLPNMFVANLASVGGGSCKTSERTNVQFPNPGQYVTTKKASPNMNLASSSDYPLAVPAGCGDTVYSPPAQESAPAAPAAPAPAPSNPAPANPAPAAPTTMVPSVAPSAPAASGSKPRKKTSTIKKRPVATQTGAATGSKPSAAVSLTLPAPSSGSCASGSVACSGVNSIICVDDGHFGICDYNGCAISQAVAPGTMCSGGAITWAKSKKRHIAKHVHVRHH